MDGGNPYQNVIESGKSQGNSDESPKGPMTSGEIHAVWKQPKDRAEKTKKKETDKQKTGGTGGTSWKKGLPKSVDKPGEWDVYNADTLPGAADAERDKGKRNETRANASRRDENAKRGGQVDTKKTDTKIRPPRDAPSTASSTTAPHKKGQPPRGGRKE